MLDFQLFLGGTRSGKSMCAEREALRSMGTVIYAATAAANDAAMQERVRRHQARRPVHWRTLECRTSLAAAVEKELATLPSTVDGYCPVVLLDCVTMWLFNILCDLPDPENLMALEDAARHEVLALFDVMKCYPCRWLLVSGEIGLGGIQDNTRSRHFCDCLGMVNQLLATKAAKVWLCVAGKKLLLED